MGRMRNWWRWSTAAVVLVLLSGCSSDDDGEDEAGPMDGTTTTEATYPGGAPHISSPPGDGEITAPQPAPPLPDGYVEEEYFLAGTATSFEASETPDDGTWDATPAEDAHYQTRVIVRRPADAAEFSGTVLVEWFNVSALEAAPDWAYLSGAIGRDGHAYVGVSAQAQGVEGGDTLLDVDVDEEQADAAGEDGAAATDSSGLKNTDPDRYDTLEHPGDAYAFDIFSQVGRVVTDSPGDLLGDLVPDQVIAMGESQSAMFLTTLINAVHPLGPTFDSFLVHSRGATVPSLDGSYTRSSDREDADDGAPNGVLVRTDLDVPVLQVEAETDLTVLGFVHARQPDTELIRTWEIAGTAHADSETLRAALGGPRDPEIGDLLGCGPVNSGPHKEVLRAALAHLVEWTAGGPPPPDGDRLEVDTDGEPAVVRDERGNALGGIRTPMVDVPTATLTGEPAEDSGGICSLFGQTIPFDQDTLVELYGDADTYLELFGASADEAVDAGFMLRPDADALIEDMEPNRGRFP